MALIYRVACHLVCESPRSSDPEKPPRTLHLATLHTLLSPSPPASFRLCPSMRLVRAGVWSLFCMVADPHLQSLAARACSLATLSRSIANTTPLKKDQFAPVAKDPVFDIPECLSSPANTCTLGDPAGLKGTLPFTKAQTSPPPPGPNHAGTNQFTVLPGLVPVFHVRLWWTVPAF